MKKYTYFILAAVMVFAASCGNTINPKKSPKSSLDSFSYIVGYNIGKGMKSQGLDKMDYGSMIHGIEDALNKDSGYLIKEELQMPIQKAYMTKAQEKKIKEYQEANKKWMEENGKKSGVTTLPSKGQFKMVKAGNGPVPQLYDTVEYALKVTNNKGKVIYDGRGPGQSMKRTVSELGLAPLEEAFQKAAEGSTFEVYLQNEIYPALSRNSQGFEESYSISIFTIDLIKVVHGTEPKPDAEQGPKLEMPKKQ